MKAEPGSAVALVQEWVGLYRTHGASTPLSKRDKWMDKAAQAQAIVSYLTRRADSGDEEARALFSKEEE